MGKTAGLCLLPDADFAKKKVKFFPNGCLQTKLCANKSIHESGYYGMCTRIDGLSFHF